MKARIFPRDARRPSQTVTAYPRCCLWVTTVRLLSRVSHGGARNTGCVVVTRVVHEDDLVGSTALREHPHDVLEDASDVLRLVMGRDRQADVDLG